MATKLEEAERAVLAALLNAARAASALLDESRSTGGPARERVVIVQPGDVATLRAALDVWHDAEDARATAMVRELRGEDDEAPAGVTS